MFKSLTSRTFLIHLALFCLFNVFLYWFLSFGNGVIPLSKINYDLSAHHFIADNRIEGRPFSLINSLGQYDAQWYLKIAKDWYSYSPNELESINQKSIMQNLTFCFLPLFPLLIKFLYFFIPSIELAAFVLTNILLVFAFASLYLFVEHFYNTQLASKTAWMLFTFPASIFFRSYFTESLMLILVIWFLFFLIKRQFIQSAVFLALLNITKNRAFPLDFLFLIILVYDYYKKKITAKKAILSLAISFFPIAVWMGYNYHVTGNPIFFTSVGDAWLPVQRSLVWLYNLSIISNCMGWQISSVQCMSVDSVIFLLVAAFLIWSKKHLRPELWWLCFFNWILPFFMVNFMSFARYQIISFPIFLVLSQFLSNRRYNISLFFNVVLFFIFSLFFINWYFVG